MSFHIVLRHPAAPQSRQNQWLDDSRPEWITTIPEVAMRCRELARRLEPLRIHRTEWGGQGPIVCCECEVGAVREIDEHQYHVELLNHRRLEILPLVRAVRGQACYEV